MQNCKVSCDDPETAQRIMTIMRQRGLECSTDRAQLLMLKIGAHQRTFTDDDLWCAVQRYIEIMPYSAIDD